MMFYVVIGLAGLVVYGTRWLKANIQPKANREKENLRKMVKDREQEAEELNNPSTFAAYSKFNKKTEELKKQMNELPDFEASTDLGMLISFMPYTTCLLFIGQYHDFSIIGDHTFWPVDFLLGYQEQKTFHLSLVSWYLLVLIIIKRFI
jgi:hypothetical protein